MGRRGEGGDQNTTFPWSDSGFFHTFPSTRALPTIPAPRGLDPATTSLTQNRPSRHLLPYGSRAIGAPLLHTSTTASGIRPGGPPVLYGCGALHFGHSRESHAQFRLITPPAAPTEVPKWANPGRPDKIDVGFTKPPVRAPPGVCRSRTTIPTNPNHRRYVNLASSRSTIFGSAALGRTRAVFDLKVDVGFAPRGAAARGHHPGTRRNRSAESHRPPGATAAAVRNPTSIS